MLTHVQDLGFRVGQFAAKPLPSQEISEILGLIAEFYGADVTPATLVPHPDEAALRERVRQAAPTVAAIADAARDALESDYSGILIPSLQLDHLELDQRSFVLFALTLCLGRPTATDRVERRIVWDIKARDPGAQAAGHVPTFSEHAYEADLHTDTQYFPEPERYLLLYFVKPAACGGGISQLRDMRCLKAQMERTEDGRWALDFLSRQELPFRIPTTFTATASPDTVEVTFARIFGTRPGIRFRTDTLKRGLEAFPDYDTADARKALAILQAEVDNLDLRLDTYIQANSVLIINNHEVLHGRSEFSDHERHALRIRISDDVPQDETRVILKTA